MPERDNLDRLIDSELARYAEPRTGLEQRILARAESEEMSQPGVFRRWQRWVFTGSAVAVALLFLVLVQRTTHHETDLDIARSTIPNHSPVTSTTAVPDTHIPIPQLQPTEKPTHHVTHRLKSIQALGVVQHPKLDVFPAPQPLTDQEQALVAVATATSDSARENLMASKRQLEAPLQISAIDIPPLIKPDEGNN